MFQIGLSMNGGTSSGGNTLLTNYNGSETDVTESSSVKKPGEVKFL